MSIFEHLDYRDFLIKELKKRKKGLESFTQSSLAEATGIRSTYLTNVLKGRGNFNSDQIYAIAKELKMNPSETQYFFLLKEYDQSVSKERKQDLLLQINKLRTEVLKTENYIQAKVRKDNSEFIMKYYSDPYIKVIHVLLQIPRFSKNYLKISEALNIQNSYLKSILEILVDLNIISINEKSVEVIEKNFHLPKDSPMLLPHQILMRSKSTQRLQELATDQRYSFSVTFTGTEETRKIIHTKFLELLKEAEPVVKNTSGENVYQMNFDLFPWNI